MRGPGRLWPAFSNCPAIGRPILPVPINPIFMLSPCSLEICRASFETRPSGAPQDEELSLMPSKQSPHAEKRSRRSRDASRSTQSINAAAFLLQRVEAEGVVPQDLLSAFVAQRQREEAVHRLGIFRIAVRIVGRRDELVLADRRHDMRDEFLVAFAGAEALPAEIFRRLGREMRHLALWLAPLVMLA